MKQAFPEVEIEILERNRPDDTFGFGVVFSDETLSFFEDADPVSASRSVTGSAPGRRSRPDFAARGSSRPDTASPPSRALSSSPSCGSAPRRSAARSVSNASSRPERSCPQADLVIGCDGVNSAVRERFAGDFEATIDLRPNRFSWLGTDFAAAGLHLHLRETEHGLFQVHAYPFAAGRTHLDRRMRRGGLAQRRTRPRERDGDGGVQRTPLRSAIWTDTACSPIAPSGGSFRPCAAAAGTAATSSCSATPPTPRTTRSAPAPSSRWRTRSRSSRPSRSRDRRRSEPSSRPTRRRGGSTSPKLQRAAQVSLEWFENASRLPGAGDRCRSSST